MSGGPTRRLRVLRVYHSGAVRAWRDRERSLLDAGVDVTLVAARSWNEGGADVALGTDHEEWVVPAGTVGTHPYLFAYDPRPLWRLLRANRFDVLDVHEEPASLAAFEVRVLARLAGHGRTPLVLYSAENIEKRYPIPFRWFERGALRRAAALYPCNDDAGRIARAKGFRGISRTIPLGTTVEPDDADPAPRPEGPTFRIGYVGRLTELKGVQDALDAVALLPDRFVLEVVGDGPYRPELERRVDRLGLHARVRFHGYVDAADTRAAYRTFDVLVVPSRTMPTLKEQFGRVVVEAMAAGTPVIASSSGSLPELVADAGLIVDEGDVRAWADALLRLDADAALRTELTERGRRRAARFDWSVIGTEQADLYREVAR